MFSSNKYVQRGLEIQDKNGKVCVGSRESVLKHLERLGREDYMRAQRHNTKAHERKKLEEAKRLVRNAKVRERYRERKELEEAKRVVRNAKARERYAQKRREQQV